MGGVSPQFRSADPPPPAPCPPGPLSCQGSIATRHTYGGAKGTRKIFFVPLAHVAPLPAQALQRGWEAPPPPPPPKLVPVLWIWTQNLKLSK